MQQGSLAEVSVLDALSAAAESSRRQVIDVSCPLGRARFVVDGGLLEARYADWLPPSAPLARMVFDLLRQMDGRVTMTPASRFEAMDQPVGFPALIRGLEALASEYERLSAIGATDVAKVELAPQLHHPAVVLDEAQWALMRAIGHGATIAQLCRRLGFDELEMRRRLCEALAQGIVVMDARLPVATPTTPVRPAMPSAPFSAPDPATVTGGPPTARTTAPSAHLPATIGSAG